MTAMAVSLEEARAAKSKVREMIADQPVVSGVGLVRVGPGWMIKVNVVREASEFDVPQEVDGVPVRVEVVGRIAAQ